ncbi:ccmE [Candidatus Endolissoclinum faulkneri L5]|uniref:Cytochrome c-type biogenesis protein CcmE n=1 Tax=Candidatus Endolissoclinum faulkneri L5 TaxID=1401328 RepID=V9TW22_9PROT|nr:cytochrome c maturation protein CcmE [Candidatus Endolissoclinum faulkneri]AHC73525.1 ccmE [Candidatus Endolissoclinum faulkneri L5]
MISKNYRLGMLIGFLAFIGTAVALVLIAFEDSVVFFFTPTELQSKQVNPERRIRVGGLVEDGSTKRGPADAEIRFKITDGNTTVTIRYIGILPDLFREGQGVVAQGYLQNAVFQADEVLAKHDENYMPRNLASAMNK